MTTINILLIIACLALFACNFWLNRYQRKTLRKDGEWCNEQIERYNDMVSSMMSYHNGVQDVHDYVLKCAETMKENEMPDHVHNLIISLAQAIHREFALDVALDLKEEHDIDQLKPASE